MTKNKYVFCFIFDSLGKVLVLKRADFMRARPGEWDVPGGRVDAGESQEDGIRREVYEETSLSVGQLELIVRKTGEKYGEEHEFSYYRAEVENSEVVLSEEHSAFEWHEPLVAAAMVVYKPHIFGFSQALSIAQE